LGAPDGAGAETAAEAATAAGAETGGGAADTGHPEAASNSADEAAAQRKKNFTTVGLEDNGTKSGKPARFALRFAGWKRYR
jgi:hypothetical protein